MYWQLIDYKLLKEDYIDLDRHLRKTMPDVRLIDATRLHAQVFNDNGGDLSKTENVAQILLKIENSPTIDAQPVKHGRWIETRRYRDADGCIVSDYSCSECGSVLRETNPDDRDSEFYCYRCGAKMEV